MCKILEHILNYFMTYLSCRRGAKAANAHRPANTRATATMRALGLNRLPYMDWLTTMPSSGGRMQRSVLERCEQRVRAQCRGQWSSKTLHSPRTLLKKRDHEQRVVTFIRKC